VSELLGEDGSSTRDDSTAQPVISPECVTQRGILRRPRVFTHDTDKYVKHDFLSSSGEPYSVDDVVADKIWKILWI
jgi:hypothetical protein